MALHGNYSVLLKGPGRFVTGTTIAQVRSNFGRGGAVKAMWSSAARVDQNNGVPQGYRHPFAWVMAQKGNAIASRNVIENTGSVSFSNLAGGLGADTILAALMQFTNANMALVSGGATTILCTMTISQSDINGTPEGAAVLHVNGSVTEASLGALASALATLPGTFSFSLSDLRSTGSISADILPFTELSPQSLAAEVAAMQIDPGVTLQEAIRIVLAVAAGKTTITDLGGGSATVVFRDTSDLKDRLSADMVGSERINVSIDAS